MTAMIAGEKSILLVISFFMLVLFYTRMAGYDTQKIGWYIADNFCGICRGFIDYTVCIDSKKRPRVTESFLFV